MLTRWKRTCRYIDGGGVQPRLERSSSSAMQDGTTEVSSYMCCCTRHQYYCNTKRIKSLSHDRHVARASPAAKHNPEVLSASRRRRRLLRASLEFSRALKNAHPPSPSFPCQPPSPPLRAPLDEHIIDRSCDTSRKGFERASVLPPQPPTLP